MTAIEFIKSKKFSFKPTFDGVVQRFDRGGKILSGWAVGKTMNCAGQPVQMLLFGDFATDEKFEWWSRKATTAAEQAEMNAAIATERARHAKEKLAKNKETAGIVKEFWMTLPGNDLTPYILKKGLTDTYGAATDEDENLYVPLADVAGKLWNLQRISPDGSKKFHPGGRITGLFFKFGSLPDSLEREPIWKIFLCEGFATGASIFEAIRENPSVVFGQQTELQGSGADNFAVCATFTAGNLIHVARELRKKYPTATLIVCGDDDRFTKRPDGSAFNPGREKAEMAARESRALLTFPRFDSVRDAAHCRGTDFNDLHLSSSLKLVAEQLASAKSLTPPMVAPSQDTGLLQSQNAAVQNPPVEAPQETMDGLTRLPLQFTPKGKPIAMLEKDVVDHILKFYGGHLVKDNRDLFLFVGTHWRHLQPVDLDIIKTQIQFVHGGDANTQKLNSIFNMLMIYTPGASREMFAPAPWVANFRNGTLFARKQGQDYRVEFKPHNALDFLVNVLPFDYPEDWASKDWRKLNSEFAAMLERVFEDADDKEERIRAIGQMFGACLMPTFPRLFMLYGPSGTGKSTIMKIAARLVDAANRCNVEPHEFHGFNMESMAGKLVNMDTDISITEPISDGFLKKIEDSEPIKIHRKGLKDINVPLPMTHIFGGNEIPRTLDGVSRAHGRRWTFLEFTRVVATTGYDKDFANVCFEKGPEGVLNFALAGLTDLLSNRGHFINPTSGKLKMEEWQIRGDIVGQFLNDLNDGEVEDRNTQLIVWEQDKIDRAKLWTEFKNWYKETHGTSPRMSRNRFYEIMRAKLGPEFKSHGVWVFKGFKQEVRRGALI